MPFIIKPRRVLVAVAALSAALVISAAPAQAELTPSSCTAPALSQPFLYAGDSNYYALVPGQSPGQFEGKGWVLSGGAKVVKSRTGGVLDLPSGSKAVS